MELNLITLNIIICIVLVVSCWVIWFFVEPDSLKISTKDVVALIVTALIILVGFLPFLTPETVSKTDYTSFTITELSDKTTTVTVKEKKRPTNLTNIVKLWILLSKDLEWEN